MPVIALWKSACHGSTDIDIRVQSLDIIRSNEKTAFVPSVLYSTHLVVFREGSLLHILGDQETERCLAIP